MQNVAGFDQISLTREISKLDALDAATKKGISALMSDDAGEDAVSLLEIAADDNTPAIDDQHVSHTASRKLNSAFTTATVVSPTVVATPATPVRMQSAQVTHNVTKTPPTAPVARCCAKMPFGCCADGVSGRGSATDQCTPTKAQDHSCKAATAIIPPSCPPRVIDYSCGAYNVSATAWALFDGKRDSIWNPTLCAREHNDWQVFVDLRATWNIDSIKIEQKIDGWHDVQMVNIYGCQGSPIQHKSCEVISRCSLSVGKGIQYCRMQPSEIDEFLQEKNSCASAQKAFANAEALAAKARTLETAASKSADARMQRSAAAQSLQAAETLRNAVSTHKSQCQARTASESTACSVAEMALDAADKEAQQASEMALDASQSLDEVSQNSAAAASLRAAQALAKALYSHKSACSSLASTPPSSDCGTSRSFRYLLIQVVKTVSGFQPYMKEISIAINPTNPINRQNLNSCAAHLAAEQPPAPSPAPTIGATPTPHSLAPTIGLVPAPTVETVAPATPPVATAVPSVALVAPILATAAPTVAAAAPTVAAAAPIVATAAPIVATAVPTQLANIVMELCAAIRAAVKTYTSLVKAVNQYHYVTDKFGVQKMVALMHETLEKKQGALRHEDFKQHLTNLSVAFVKEMTELKYAAQSTRWMCQNVTAAQHVLVPYLRNPMGVMPALTRWNQNISKLSVICTWTGQEIDTAMSSLSGFRTRMDMAMLGPMKSAATLHGIHSIARKFAAGLSTSKSIIRNFTAIAGNTVDQIGTELCPVPNLTSAPTHPPQLLYDRQRIRAMKEAITVQNLIRTFSLSEESTEGLCSGNLDAADVCLQMQNSIDAGREAVAALQASSEVSRATQVTGVIQAIKLMGSSKQAVKHALDLCVALVRQHTQGIGSVSAEGLAKTERSRYLKDALEQTLSVLQPATDTPSLTGNRAATVQNVMMQLNTALSTLASLTDKQALAVFTAGYSALETAFGLTKNADVLTVTVPESMVPDQEQRSVLSAKLRMAMKNLQLASNFIVRRSKPAASAKTPLDALGKISSATLVTALEAFNSTLQAYAIASDAQTGTLPSVLNKVGAQLSTVLKQTSAWFEQLRAQNVAANQIKEWLNHTAELKSGMMLAQEAVNQFNSLQRDSKVTTAARTVPAMAKDLMHDALRTVRKLWTIRSSSRCHAHPNKLLVQTAAWLDRASKENLEALNAVFAEKNVTMVEVPKWAPLKAPTPTVTPTTLSCSSMVRADVLLVMDASGSISSENWATFLASVRQIIRALPLAPTQMKLGLLEYNNNVKLIQRLDSSKDSLIRSLNLHTSPFAAGRTYMGKAVSVGLDEFSAYSTTPNQVMLIITDGIPTDRKAAEAALRLASVRKIQTQMLLVGERAAASEGLSEQLFSRPHIRLAAGFKDFADAVTTIAEGLCSMAKVAAKVTALPTLQPTILPTTRPPTLQPSGIPSRTPTEIPTAVPSPAPSSHAPSMRTGSPSVPPSNAPTHIPTSNPTMTPTHKPTVAPTHKPTVAPTHKPTVAPTQKPSMAPSMAPSAAPSKAPIPCTVCSLPPKPAPCTVCPSAPPTCTKPCKPAVWPRKYTQDKVTKLISEISKLNSSIEILKVERADYTKTLEQLEQRCNVTEPPTAWLTQAPKVRMQRTAAPKLVLVLPSMTPSPTNMPTTAAPTGSPTDVPSTAAPTQVLTCAEAASNFLEAEKEAMQAKKSAIAASKFASTHQNDTKAQRTASTQSQKALAALQKAVSAHKNMCPPVPCIESKDECKESKLAFDEAEKQAIKAQKLAAAAHKEALTKPDDVTAQRAAVKQSQRATKALVKALTQRKRVCQADECSLAKDAFTKAENAASKAQALSLAVSKVGNAKYRNAAVAAAQRAAKALDAALSLRNKMCTAKIATPSPTGITRACIPKEDACAIAKYTFSKAQHEAKKAQALAQSASTSRCAAALRVFNKAEREAKQAQSLALDASKLKSMASRKAAVVAARKAAKALQKALAERKLLCKGDIESQHAAAVAQSLKASKAVAKALAERKKLCGEPKVNKCVQSQIIFDKAETEAKQAQKLALEAANQASLNKFSAKKQRRAALKSQKAAIAVGKALDARKLVCQ
jgi:uncharacterized protein YegL